MAILTFEGALIREQGVTFGVVVVRPHLLESQNAAEANRLISAFEQQVFGQVPVVLMAQNGQDAPKYYGRKDVARFLASVPLRSIPWKKYTVTFS
ncbi:MAG: hypothetical protein ACYC3S_04685 [Chloroflexota bacterium]